MSEKVKGKCKYCGKEFTRGYIIRHLASCKERKQRLESEAGKKTCGYFELLITAKYDSDYWLVIEVKDTAFLKDIDNFLRDIWLECCGHLSAFEINGVSYESFPDPDPFWGREAKSMNCRLKTVLQKGMRIGYEYDFGSTTELMIEVKDYRFGNDGKEKLKILSRNNAVTYMCGRCGKREAVYINSYQMYGENPFWCKECSKQVEPEENYLLNVCNSPRMGVCAYEGSDVYPEQFVPDTEV